MTENEIVVILRNWLADELPKRGVADVPVVRAYQPEQQGRPEAPAVLFSKVGDGRIGQRKNAEKWNPQTLVMQRTEIQNKFVTWQFGAIIDEDPASLSQLTATDIVQRTAAALQSESFIYYLRQFELGVLPIQSIRTPYGTNDRDQYESDPSFDVTITYRDTYVETVQHASSAGVEIHRI